jgi:hypothetical protein
LVMREIFLAGPRLPLCLVSVNPLIAQGRDGGASPTQVRETKAAVKRRTPNGKPDPSQRNKSGGKAPHSK